MTIRRHHVYLFALISIFISSCSSERPQYRLDIDQKRVTDQERMTRCLVCENKYKNDYRECYDQASIYKDMMEKDQEVLICMKNRDWISTGKRCESACR